MKAWIIKFEEKREHEVQVEAESMERAREVAWFAFGVKDGVSAEPAKTYKIVSVSEKTGGVL